MNAETMATVLRATLLSLLVVVTVALVIAECIRERERQRKAAMWRAIIDSGMLDAFQRNLVTIGEIMRDAFVPAMQRAGDAVDALAIALAMSPNHGPEEHDGH